MDHENGVIMVKIAVADRRPGDVRGGKIALDINDRLVAGQSTVDAKRERLEHRLACEARKYVGRGQAFVIAALGSDVVKSTAFGQVDLDYSVKTRRRGAVFQDGHISTRLDFDDNGAE